MLTASLLALATLAPQVGPQGDSPALPTGRIIHPAGSVLEVPGRPVDLALSPDGSTVFVKDNTGLRILDAKGWTERQALTSPEGTSLTGLAVSRSGRRVLLSSSGNAVHEYATIDGTTYRLLRSFQAAGPKGEGASFPCGIALSPDETLAYVCLSRNNTLGVLRLRDGEWLAQIPVGVAPYEVALDGNVAYVTNQGGDKPKAGAPTAPSAGTETEVDERGIAKGGSLSIVDLEARREVATVPVGLQPAGLVALPEEGLVLVANANDDSVSWVDVRTRKELSRLITKPDSKLPFGSMPNALALSSDHRTLYVANAGNNAVAVVDLSNARRPQIRGFVPAGWYPTALAVDQQTLLVASAKGVGSRTVRRNPEEGWNSHDHSGTVQRIDLAGDLRTWTQTVKADLHVPQILASYERRSAAGIAASPVPQRLGDPSVFNHVIYVIKENRTYDQMFGDMPKGDGMAALCTFKEENAPNHRALANEFVLLDNYYCNGVLSADGHSWATEGNVTPYLERAFGGFSRSYTFGDDPLTYSSTGFLWNHVLAGGLSFRNYGEMDYAEPPKGMTGKQVWEEYVAGKRTVFSQNMGIEHLRRYSCRDYPGWNMNIPDQLRVDRFLEEFREFEKDGKLPNLLLVYLPQDHLGGAATARSNMADNDLAVGRLVEAVSKSRFWKDTVIFINEDDPQNGYDHVDGHRSICLVASPYTKRGSVVSEFYNQTAVLHTILQIFGLPPMNQQDASAPLMTTCFTDTPDFRPYTARPNQVPLDEFKNPSTMSAQERYWERILAKIPLNRTGTKTLEDMDNLNRMMWHAMRGYDTPYPAEWAGAHGRGLAKRGLKVVEDGG
ncbi:MAG: bifunctional YncE family protein/alkaline phosphatase family protein [Chthonomonadaceae bacterium]|nr:bifunctional YncE family protein/alkaline phosphatase family protein [Chthonomonadaceae bacterium]